MFKTKYYFTTLISVISLTSIPLIQSHADSASSITEHRLKKINKNPDVDISPSPAYSGAYISGGMTRWKKSQTLSYVGASAASGGAKAVPANCSTRSIVHYANLAPSKFQIEKKGLLYGVRTHTLATRVDNIPGYNSCALVVYAIMKKAGCKWMKRTANAKSIYDMAYKRGWKPTAVQRAGCIVAWNAKSPGFRARIGRGSHRKKGQSRGVAYRHVGITTGAWMAMDNTSIFSRPSAFITTRPIRYEPPLFLCPPKKKKK